MTLNVLHITAAAATGFVDEDMIYLADILVDLELAQQFQIVCSMGMRSAIRIITICMIKNMHFMSIPS